MELQRVKLQMIKCGAPIYTLEKISEAKDVVELINTYEKYDLATMSKIIVIALNNKNQVNTYAEIATGTIDNIIFDPSEIFKIAILSNSNKFILACSRPSGNCTPQKDDIEIMNAIKKAAKIMKLDFLDYILIGENNKYTSVFTYEEND